MAPDRLSFSAIDFWSRREAEVLSVTLQGLKALGDQPPPARDEDSLNWALAEYIRQAVLAGRRSGLVSLEPPALEPKSLSTGSVTLGPEARDRKRPDLVWQLCDELAPVGGIPFLEMVIECKRLGDGDLCRLYVAKGVARFVNEEHAYAKNMRSGFMVGYLQGMGIQDAQQGISGALDAFGLAPLSDALLSGATFGQKLARSYPANPFLLHHLWQAV